MNQPYDNTRYWTKIHEKHSGKFKSVGWHGLSESYNKLSYQSKKESVIHILKKLEKELPDNNISILDIGAGWGYWSDFLYNYFHNKSCNAKITAFDISQNALDIIKKNNPKILTECADLKKIDIKKHEQKFDLVVAFNCLHHLTRIEQYQRALQFCASSVKKNGFFILMDPMLEKPYSRFDVIDFKTYTGHGIDRHLYITDDILFNQGMNRIIKNNAVSFVFSGNIEGYTYTDYHVIRFFYQLLRRFVYKYEWVTNITGWKWKILNRFFKRTYSCGTKIVAYRKTPIQK